jgi:hypothetical protein
VAKDGAGEGRVTGLDGKKRRCRVCGSQAPQLDQRCGHDDYEWVDAPVRQDHVAHPTVKPLDLMRWLVRLVTPPGGVCLDMFAGSGTTGEAAILEHKRAILIEREADYLPLIVSRLTRRTDPAAYAALHRTDDEPDDLLSLLLDGEASAADVIVTRALASEPRPRHPGHLPACTTCECGQDGLPGDPGHIDTDDCHTEERTCAPGCPVPDFLTALDRYNIRNGAA